jgi:hypothetical protein
MARTKAKTKTRLNNLTQAALELGIPYDHLRIVKKLYPEGFVSNGNIIRENVLTYYQSHQAEVEAMALDGLQALKEKKLKNDILLQEFEIEEAKKSVVPIEEVKEFLSTFGLLLGSTLKSGLTKELPPHVVGLKEEDVVKLCKEFYNTLIQLISKNLKDWSTTPKE